MLKNQFSLCFINFFKKWLHKKPSKRLQNSLKTKSSADSIPFPGPNFLLYNVLVIFVHSVLFRFPKRTPIFTSTPNSLSTQIENYFIYEQFLKNAWLWFWKSYVIFFFWVLRFWRWVAFFVYFLLFLGGPSSYCVFLGPPCD